MGSNATIFDKGMTKAIKAIDKQLENVWKTIAMDLLYDAVQRWEGFNMTGNTINSYASAVFKDSTMIAYYDAYDAGVGDRATSTYAYPGDYIYFYHSLALGEDPNYSADMNSRGTVRKYNSSKYEFQQVGRGSGEDDAKALARRLGETNKGLSVFVMVGVPYAQYLENVRKLTVLKENEINAKSITKESLAGVKPLNID